MGRKGSWITAIKKAFSSKEKSSNEFLEKRSRKAKPSLREGSSFIPIFRQPSSVEKILWEVEREQHKVRDRPQSLPSEKQPQKTNVHLRTTSSRHGSLRNTSPRAAVSPKASSSKAVIRNKPYNSYRPDASATKVQAAYRGYMARRSFRALKGLVRLQGVVKGQNVQRQTADAMRQMQLMVRIQTQIQSRRIQLLENHSLIKWQTASESGIADWEDSVLTKDEMEARMQSKMEAAIKRERAMAYAYSHAQLKGTPKSSLDTFPWWWNWLERRLPSKQPQESPAAIRTPNHPPPARTTMPNRMSPQPQSRNHKQSDPYESLTTRSTKSSFISRWKQSQNPTPGSATKLKNPNRPKYPKPRPTADDSPFDTAIKDDDSLNSCPPFSAPSYMAPTASAKAKVKATDKQTPTATTSRRFSFPLTQGINRNKGSSPFSNKDPTNDSSQRKLDKVESFHSTGNLSVESLQLHCAI